MTFVAVGSSGDILRSPDGLTWTREASGTVADFSGIATHDGGCVVGGFSGVLMRNVDCAADHIFDSTFDR
jgi:hypothetical protein